MSCYGLSWYRRHQEIIHWERGKQQQNNMYTGSYKNVKIQLVFFALAVMTKLSWSIKEDTLVHVDL